MFDTMKQPALWILAAMSLCAQNSSDLKIDSPQARVHIINEQPQQPTTRHDRSPNRALVYIDSGQMIDMPAGGKSRKIDVKAGFVRWSPRSGQLHLRVYFGSQDSNCRDRVEKHFACSPVVFRDRSAEGRSLSITH